jgi:heat shock protein HslJ
MKRFLLSMSCVALAACASPARPTLASPNVAGKTWVAASVAPGTDPQQRPRLEFLSGGKLGGYTGCNTLGGTWRVAGDAVQVGALVLTKRACLGPGADVEKRFLASVNEKSRFVIEGSTLVARGAGGERFEFSEAP